MRTKPLQSISFFALVAVLLIVYVAISSSQAHGSDVNQGKKYVPHGVLVRFLAGTNETDKEAIRQSLGAEKIKLIKSIQVEYWRLPEDITTQEAL